MLHPCALRDQGVVYTDLLGLEVFPAVCFYSSGRTISLVKVCLPLLCCTPVLFLRVFLVHPSAKTALL